jgi:large subunit ribosomal protein L35
MKTHSGAKKRFKLTSKGKVKRRSANLNHINAKMSSKRKRHLGKPAYISDVDAPQIKQLLAS